MEEKTINPQFILEQWSTNYLVEQEVRRKWKNPSTENQLDKIVLIREDDKLSRNVWKIGRIIQVHPSKDGLIRNVTVKTASQTLRRPVQKLAVFENYQKKEIRNQKSEKRNQKNE